MILDSYSMILLAMALGTDSFSVSLTKGFSQKGLTKSQILWYAIFFGGSEALMALIGYFFGNQLSGFVSNVATWIGFILLLLIGLNMIRDGLKNDEETVDAFSFKEVTLLSIATSIDAFAVGLTFALLHINYWIPILLIGSVAFIFTIIGALIGKKLGDYLGDKFLIIGGIILIIIGLKILLGI